MVRKETRAEKESRDRVGFDSRCRQSGILAVTEALRAASDRPPANRRGQVFHGRSQTRERNEQVIATGNRDRRYKIYTCVQSISFSHFKEKADTQIDGWKGKTDS